MKLDSQDARNRMDVEGGLYKERLSTKTIRIVHSAFALVSKCRLTPPVLAPGAPTRSPVVARTGATAEPVGCTFIVLGSVL